MNILQYLNIPLEFSIIVLVTTLAGYYTDQYFEVEPLFTILGVFAGLCAGFYQLLRAVERINKDSDKNK